ncbi:MAG: translation elongation factor Ts [Maricaulaceae bacterium]|jgi:elongation factor Ts
MAEITAGLVKELREKTGAGMMDCKKALTETGADFEGAIDWLRKKGLSKAAKKADRVAADGLVGAASKREGTAAVGAAVEVNAETDFVARNETFQAFVGEATKLALGDAESVEKLLEAKTSGGESVQDKITSLIATIGENMAVRRLTRLSVDPGVVAVYIHNQAADGLGKIAVLVALKSAGDAAALDTLGRDIAMHVAAASPLAARVEELDPAVVEKEREVFSEQARASGKPENIIEKMVEGRLRKFYQESVLLEQAFVKDPDSQVKAVIEKAAKDVGAPVELVGFVRMELGEGVEKKQEDFAAEVAAATGGS